MDYVKEDWADESPLADDEALRPAPMAPWERLALIGMKTAFKEFKARPHWYLGYGMASGSAPWAELAEDWRIIENTVCMAMDDEAKRIGDVSRSDWPDVRGVTLRAVEAFLGRSYPRHAPPPMAVATWGVASRLSAARVLHDRKGDIRDAFDTLLGKARQEGRLGPAVDQEQGSWLTKH